jgi:hypothetical protein
MYYKIFGIIVTCLLAFSLQAQEIETANVIGKVIDEEGLPVIGANVFLEDTEINTQTNIDGEYNLQIPADKTFTLVFSAMSYTAQKRPNLRLEAGAGIRVDIQMGVYTTVEYIVTPFEKREIDAIYVEKKDIEKIVVTDGNLTSLIKFLAPGVTAGTGGELTSQYSVRGGNYDENLVYVNDFEIYRPLLVRSGQQEGLILPNGDMLDYLTFSAGAFKAQYGDKMSSVLDVQYRRPHEFEASVGGSLLGGSLYFGGSVYRDSAAKARKSPQRFSYTFGARYKTTSYLLSSLDIKGEYVPQFFDLQTNLIYDINKHWQVELLGHYSNSIYSLQPQEQSTTTGLFNYALRLSVAFQGQEISNFENYTIGTATTFLPWGAAGKYIENDTTSTVSSNLRFKLLASHYQSNENERIDIINDYRLDQIETGLGEDDFGEVVGTLAGGISHLFARNFLQANVTNVQLKGTYTNKHNRLRDNLENRHILKWGVGYKNEIIDDKLKEWRRVDSLDFTLPNQAGTSDLLIPEYINTSIGLNSHRLNAFVQNTWIVKSTKNLIRLTSGVRANYWTLNKEFIVSPRVQLYYSPLKFKNSDLDTTKTTKELTFKLATGLYYQPPFYRELRGLDGEVNTDVQAQKSMHVLGGLVWDFVMFKRKFKFITEGYYKHQWDLIPYDIDNVRIRYYGDNVATGYVAGLDLRLNGELVDGLESWINLSFLRARESFDGVQHGVRSARGTSEGTVVDTTWMSDVPKATDQLFIFSMYFQDNFPKAEWAEISLAFTVGSGLPFGIPGDNVEFRNTYRFAAYHRIDIGASFNVWNRKNFKKNKCDGNEDIWKAKKHPLRSIKRMWFSLEIFNLMDARNVAQNTWVKDFSNRSFAIPNTLTSRRINVRFKIDF